MVRSQGGGGLYRHPVLAVDAEDGAIIGLVTASFLTREAGRREDRRSRRRWRRRKAGAGWTAPGVTDLAQAFAVIDLYRRRWAIEQVFRTLKTQGFDIEHLLIEDQDAVARLVMATVIAAITIQQLVHARDGREGPAPLRPLLDAFDPEDAVLLDAWCETLQGKDRTTEKSPPPGLACLRRLGLRQARRMDRRLRKAGTRRHAPRLARIPSR
ncbi:transposase [Azospirillum oleiclasticum]|uniref:transposase n=1 Tax=Azospirillum oleiclasticum TaxID=2735135 RepID=UPI001B3B979C